MPDLTELIRAIAAPVGSGLHAVWSKNQSIANRLALWLAGTLVAVIAQKEAAQHVHIDGALLNFMLGFGSIAFLSKTLEAWQSINLGGILGELLRKYLGLRSASPSKPVPLDTPKE